MGPLHAPVLGLIFFIFKSAGRRNHSSGSYSRGANSLASSARGLRYQATGDNLPADVHPEAKVRVMGRRLWRSFSAGGLLLGTLFFAAALTPTLLPRNFVTQGVLSGLSLAAGYGIGVFGRWLWAYMELPQPKGPLLRIAKRAAAVGCAIVAVIYL